jgi:AcrR family transcriptional regulator
VLAKSIQSDSQIKRARKQRILEIAETLFIERGVKGVTMELIAEQAHISKVTLYGYFPVKDSIFKAVAMQFAEKLQTAFNQALREEGPLNDRIAAALIAKHGIVFKTIRRSIYSVDLFAAKDRVVREEFEKLDKRLEKEIAASLFEMTGDRAQANRIARIMFASAQGIANAGQSLNAITSDIQMLVQGLLRPRPDKI